MVANREEAARNAEASTTNKVGTCQLWTRTQFDAPSAGDQDGDGDADAIDGWKSEPISARHQGDRNPPRGVPVAFAGGSHGFGHRAIALGHGKIRSTDMALDHYEPGHVGTTTISQIESSMGLTYLGWSETIDGVMIPHAPEPPAPVPVPPKVKNTRVTKARVLLVEARDKAKAKGLTKRAAKIQKALDILPKN